MFAKVVVDVESQKTNDLYTYIVPKEYENFVYPGSRVFVEYGVRNVLGYVVELLDETDHVGKLKEIIEVIDIENGLTKEQLELANKLMVDTKSLYTSTLGLMYPALMKSKIRKFIHILDLDNLDAELALLFNFKKKVLITKTILEKSSKLKKEIEKGNIEIVNDIYRYGSRKTTKYYRLKEHISFDLKSEKRKKVLQFLSEYPLSAKDDIKSACKVSDFIIDELLASGLIAYEEALPKNIMDKQAKFPSFDFEEKSLVDKYNKLSGKPFLLASNNERFKFDFYLDASLRMYHSGNTTLIIAPSILSSTIIYDHFKKNLVGYTILYFHSKLDNSDYYKNYKELEESNKNQEPVIIIGLSQSIFLPMNQLGLIMMLDYDHTNYQIEEYPNYSVLEVLRFRANYHNAKLLLSARVLGIEGYYNYFTAKYYLLQKFQLSETRRKVVNLVNMRNELEDLLLSRSLKDALTNNLAKKQISMLILNNSYYSSHILCKTCGEQLKCPKCRIGMSYHQEKKVYRCGYCNLQVETPSCSVCKGAEFDLYGFGLEKLKERLLELYPNSRIIVVDSRNFLKNISYEQLLIAIEENEVDFIIGTNQLVDLVNDGISLVGLISVDSLLSISDYRSSEICFNTIFKLINSFNSEIFIQGHNIRNKAIVDAVNGNFDSFYNEEIEKRKLFSYPPFMELAKLTVVGDYKDIYYYANSFKKTLFKVIEGEVLGPVYDTKAKGVRLLIKHNDFTRLSVLIDEVNKKFADKKILANFERYP